MLMNRRSEPVSSQTLARKPGYFESRLSSTSWTVAASTSTVSAPAVYFRSGAGIMTLSDMICTPECFFESREFSFDDLRWRHVQRLEGFQTVSGDCNNREVRLLDSALLDKLLRNSNGDTTCGLGEYSFGFGEQVDAGNQFVIRTVLGPSAGFRNQRSRVIAVRRITDRERFRDRIRLNGPDLSRAAPHGVDDGIATRCLRPIKARTFRLADQPQALEFFQALVNFADHGAAGHRDDNRVRCVPAQLLSHFISDRL